MPIPSFPLRAAAFYLGAAAFVGFFFLIVALAGCQAAPAAAMPAPGEPVHQICAPSNTGDVALVDPPIATGASPRGAPAVFRG